MSQFGNRILQINLLIQKSQSLLNESFGRNWSSNLGKIEVDAATFEESTEFVEFADITLVVPISLWRSIEYKKPTSLEIACGQS
jgi:hypothetical protein